MRQKNTWNYLNRLYMYFDSKIKQIIVDVDNTIVGNAVAVYH